jgi:general stress protein 26
VARRVLIGMDVKPFEFPKIGDMASPCMAYREVLLEQYPEKMDASRLVRLRRGDIDIAVFKPLLMKKHKLVTHRKQSEMRDPSQTIGNLIDKQKIAFIGSVDAEDFPNMKAMLTPRKREGIKVFYFTTNTSSKRVAQYRENPKACIYFCDQRFFRGVMFKGHMEVLEGTISKEMIWREGDTM